MQGEEGDEALFQGEAYPVAFLNVGDMLKAGGMFDVPDGRAAAAPDTTPW